MVTLSIGQIRQEHESRKRERYIIEFMRLLASKDHWAQDVILLLSTSSLSLLHIGAFQKNEKMIPDLLISCSAI